MEPFVVVTIYIEDGDKAEESLVSISNRWLEYDIHI